MGCELSPCLVDLGTYQDPQAIVYANAWPQRRSIRFGFINAVNQPVLARFDRGQKIYLASIPSEYNSEMGTDRLPEESTQPMAIGVEQEPIAFEVGALQNVGRYAAQEGAGQNPLPTDNQGQRRLRGGPQ
jgi:hypothetical protein